MAKLAIYAAGNPITNTNLINARFTAEALRNIRGYDIGVLDNSFLSATSSSTTYARDANPSFMWRLSATNNNNITIGRGMATAYGFDIQSEQDYILTTTAPSTGTKYVFVYLEWNFSNPQEAIGTLDLFDNGTSSTWTVTPIDNLITNPIGRFRMPLYRIAINTAGTVTGTASWTSLGIATQSGVMLSKFSENKPQTDNSMASANTAYVRQAITDVKNITEAVMSTSLSNVTANKVRRQVNFVIGEFSATAASVPIGGTICTIPVGFRSNVARDIYGTAMILGTPSSYGGAVFTINTNGNITLKSMMLMYNANVQGNWQYGSFVFGYEIT